MNEDDNIHVLMLKKLVNKVREDIEKGKENERMIAIVESSKKRDREVFEKNQKWAKDHPDTLVPLDPITLKRLDRKKSKSTKPKRKPVKCSCKK